LICHTNLKLIIAPTPCSGPQHKVSLFDTKLDGEASKHVMMDKQQFFFDRYGLAQADVERYLAAALSAGGDYADLYFEYQTSTSVSLDESMVKSATEGISVGCGVRVMAGERTGYAYTDDLSQERLLHAARTAALIASGPAKQPVVGMTDKAA